MSKTHTIDATGQAPGRVATAVARILMGKHTAQYEPRVWSGEPVHVINAGAIKTTPKKLGQKMYYRHSKYPGGLKTTSMEKAMAKDATFIIRHAVARMLPKNNTRVRMLKNLRITA